MAGLVTRSLLRLVGMVATQSWVILVAIVDIDRLAANGALARCGGLANYALPYVDEICTQPALVTSSDWRLSAVGGRYVGKPCSFGIQSRFHHFTDLEIIFTARATCELDLVGSGIIWVLLPYET